MWTQVIFLFQDLLDQCTVNSAALSGQRFPGRCISEWLFLWHGGASINWVVLSLGIHPNPKMGFRFGKYDGFAQMWWSVPFSAKDCKPATWLFRVAKKFQSWGGTLLYLLIHHEVIQKRDIFPATHERSRYSVWVWFKTGSTPQMAVWIWKWWSRINHDYTTRQCLIAVHPQGDPSARSQWFQTQMVQLIVETCIYIYVYNIYMYIICIEKIHLDPQQKPIISIN